MTGPKAVDDDAAAVGAVAVMPTAARTDKLRPATTRAGLRRERRSAARRVRRADVVVVVDVVVDMGAHPLVLHIGGTAVAIVARASVPVGKIADTRGVRLCA